MCTNSICLCLADVTWLKCHSLRRETSFTGPKEVIATGLELQGGSGSRRNRSPSFLLPRTIHISMVVRRYPKLGPKTRIVQFPKKETTFVYLRGGPGTCLHV